MALRIFLNDAEEAALEGERPFLICLYIFGIRRYMDYETGVVGSHKRRVCWRSLMEAVYVKEQSGLMADETGTPNKSKIRRGVAALERLGLIKKKTIGKHLIFECLIADRDNSVQKQAAPIPTHQADPQADIIKFPSKPRIAIALANDVSQTDSRPDSHEMAQADPPPLSVMNIKKKDITNVISKKEREASPTEKEPWFAKFIETYPPERLGSMYQLKVIFYRVVINSEYAIKNQKALIARLKLDAKKKELGLFVETMPYAKNWLENRYFEHRLQEVENGQANRAVNTNSCRSSEISKMFKWAEDQLTKNGYEVSKNTKH